MALIFLGVLIVFYVLSFEFHKVNCRDFITNYEWSPIHPISVTELSGLEEMLESYYKLQPKLKTVPKLTNALKRI